MAKDPKRSLVSHTGGFFSDISNQIKRGIRLMADRRVNPVLKIIPIGTLAYLVIPDLIIGPFDDMAIVGLGLYMFVEFCPPEIVAEHRAALEGTVPGEWHDPQIKDEDIVDGEFRDDL
jgi:uncharacterized membrane protein YkvA (DUF1232 family)